MITSLPDSKSKHSIREQLRLFAFDVTSQPSADILLHVQTDLSMRERLATLLEGELNFHGEKSGYASHDLHAFAAKFPPQLPRAFIRGLTKVGDTILDPMMGSGTAIVEALIEDRKGIGLDIDPLALRLSNVKTTPLAVEELHCINTRIVSRALELLSEQEIVNNDLNNRFDEKTKEFIDYWFTPVTQQELTALNLAIQEVDDRFIRRFLELTFSSIIVTKSGGVSMARDLAHSRPHLDKTKVPKNAIDQFSIRLRKNINSIDQLSKNGTRASIVAGDACVMPLESDSINLVVTSPPYANAIDYMRAHKFSLVWFGASVKELSELRARYIGAERVGNTVQQELPYRAETIVWQLSQVDKSKAAVVLRKYFQEMRNVISEIYRVLREDSAAIIIVGTSMMRDINVQTHLCLADIAAERGFDVVGIAKRVLDRNKRMMPARFGKKTSSMIEQRMHEEFVIGLLKPEK